MRKEKTDLYFYNLTRALMTLLTAASLYILYFVKNITDCPEYALHYYHSYPKTVEYILAGMIVYLAFGIVFMKIYRE